MKITSSIFISILLGLPLIISGQSVVNTVHNLSVSGPGSIKSDSESEICIFCHTPHNSSPSGPLWNRSDPGATYILYNSSTIYATIGQPDGSSILCLSCHDGTIALGNVLSRQLAISFAGGVTTMPAGNSNLTANLANDHPISFIYNSALAAANGELQDPSTLTNQVTLENEKLQCISCHDPHVNLTTDFLVETTQNSILCMECHDKDYWSGTTHMSSNRTWNGNSPDPWFHTPYTTVAQNACENCHNPHNAGGNPRLLKYITEEDNCLDCHNGNVAPKNLQAQFNKTYRHNIYNYTGIHDPNEQVLEDILHVECEDCHNPHASNDNTASAPNANGFLAGVKGISQSGAVVDPIQYEYELCYRCHTATPGMPSSPTSRQLAQNNVRLEFETSNPSFHPVAGPGANPNVPSLIAPLTTSSIIYCTDCHASNGTGAPSGPHGSIYPSILKFQYNTDDNVLESAGAYALCYSCHNRNSIISENSSFKYHKKHIVDKRVPCNDCHDAHGISGTQGNSYNNSNLINFKIGNGGSSPVNGQLKFEDLGLYTGRCYLSCHGESHNPYSYSPGK